VYISARERTILDTLLSLNEEITVKQLSELLGVSERTIHRDLKGVESILNDYNILLLKKSGVGIQLSGNKNNLEQLQLTLYNQVPVEFTPEERQTIILCTLLETNEPVKLVSLANDLNVSMVTVSNDLQKLEDRLASFELSLIKKRGYGVEVTGSESAKRKTMRAIISENMDEVEFLSLVRENIQKQNQFQIDTISEKLLGLVEKEKLVIVEKIVGEVYKERDHPIADSAFIGLVVHLALAIERIQHGENITIDKAYLQSLQTTSEYQMAKQIVKKLSIVFKLDIPEAEIGYITMHLQGAKLRRDKEYLVDEKNLEASDKANLLIKFVEDELNCSLSNNFSLFSGLVTHLEPAIYRIDRRMGISNPLLGKIKEDYKDLFEIIKKGTEVIFPNKTIPDEEIGFLVLHFGSALLSNKKTSNLKALIICSTGIGTSKILATRLAREFPEIQHLKNVSLFELEQLNINDYDLVISTVKLPGFSQNYILVSPILNQEEVNKIRMIIRDKKARQLLNTQPENAPYKSDDFQTIIQKLDEVRNASNTIVDILKNFKVIAANKGNITEVLSEVCLDLEKNEVIKESQPVVEALLEREKLGGLGIPKSQLALFHARSNKVIKPTFLIVSLNNPLKVISMTQEPMEITSLLILLAPNQILSQQLEILSYISASIIEDERSLSLFESKNEALIGTFLANKLEELFWWKFNEMRD
jgi:mannitol operon transcriptional antiterminator